MVVMPDVFPVMPDVFGHPLGIGYSYAPFLHETYEKPLSSVSRRLFSRNPRNSLLETDVVPVSSVSRKLRLYVLCLH